MALWQAATQSIPEQPSLGGQVLRTLPLQSTSERRSLEQCGPLHITGEAPSPKRPPPSPSRPPSPIVPPLPLPLPPSLPGVKPALVFDPQPAASGTAAAATKARMAPPDTTRRRMLVSPGGSA